MVTIGQVQENLPESFRSALVVGTWKIHRNWCSDVWPQHTFLWHSLSQLGCSQLVQQKFSWWYETPVLAIEKCVYLFGFCEEMSSSNFYFPYFRADKFQVQGSILNERYFYWSFKVMVWMSWSHCWRPSIMNIFFSVAVWRRKFLQIFHIPQWSSLLHFLHCISTTSLLTPNEIDFLIFFSGFIELSKL